MSCEPESCLGPSLTQEAQLHCSDSDMLPGCRVARTLAPRPPLWGTELTKGQQLDWVVFWEGELCHPTHLAKCYHLIF